MNHNQYAFRGELLALSSGKSIEFEFSIKIVIPINELLIVVLEVPPKTIYNENVFAVDDKGTVVWRINKTPLFYDREDCPYISAEINEKSQLILFNWCDTAVIVDFATGCVLDKYQTK